MPDYINHPGYISFLGDDYDLPPIRRATYGNSEEDEVIDRIDGRGAEEAEKGIIRHIQRKIKRGERPGRFQTKASLFCALKEELHECLGH